MRPVMERTAVIAQCPGGHTWDTEILPGSTMPQTAGCPQCGMLVSSYPSIRAATGVDVRETPAPGATHTYRVFNGTFTVETIA